MDLVVLLQGTALQNFPGFGNDLDDYINMAIATGGATWDLNQLRAGGLTATSFTKAFVDLKVQEIIIQASRCAGTGYHVAFGTGLAGLAAFGRRRNN